MKKAIQISMILLIFISLIIVAVSELLSRPLILLPTQSKVGELSIAHYWGFPNNNIRVVLQQGGKCYSLVLNDAVYSGECQSFSLPELNDMPIELSFEIYDEEASVTKAGRFTLDFESGEKLAKTGLLVYLAQYNNSDPYYIYFISGEKRYCYSMDGNMLNIWNEANTPPIMLQLPHKDPWFIPRVKGWKPSGEWVEIHEWQKDEVIDFFLQNRDLFEHIITLFQKNNWQNVYLDTRESHQIFYDKYYINDQIANDAELSILKESAQALFNQDILNINYYKNTDEICTFRFGWGTIGIRMGYPDKTMPFEHISDNWYFYQAPQV